MLEERFEDIPVTVSGGSTSPDSLRVKNQHIISRHPTLQKTSPRVQTVLSKTKRLRTVIKYIDKTSHPHIARIMEDVFGLECAHLLLELLPLLEKIYHINPEQNMSWMDEYAHLFDDVAEEKTTTEQLMALARIKQIIEARILHGGERVASPSTFVDTHLQEHVYSISPRQLISVFLILELARQRIGYIGELRSTHGDNLRGLFAEVTTHTLPGRNPINSATQQGPFLSFHVPQETLTSLRTKKTRGVFYREAKNPRLGSAFVFTDQPDNSYARHEQQHNINDWITPEQALCTQKGFYFPAKDEILAYLSARDRSLMQIFTTLFTFQMYDPYLHLKDTPHSYDYWHEDYRRILLTSIILSQLLIGKIGAKNAIDVLSFIHFRSWKTELKRMFDIQIPPSLDVLTGLPGKEKQVFAELEKL